MSRRTAARELVRAASTAPAGRGPVSEENARLLRAVELLRSSAGEAPSPDPGFTARLRADLLARHGELAARGGRRLSLRRVAWTALPAAAAAAAVFLVLALFVFGPSPAPPVANLTVQNGYARLASGGKTVRVDREAEVREGDNVSLPGGSRATLTFENESITRLEAGSSLTVERYDDVLVELALHRGRSYNRVTPGTDHSVLRKGARVRSAGTAYGVDAPEGETLAPVFHGRASVEAGGAAPVAVEQGEMGIIAQDGGGPRVQVVPIDLARLEFSWLAFNRDLDRELGLPLGVLESLGATPPEGVQPPGTAPGAQPSSAPAAGQSVPPPPPDEQKLSSSLSVADPGPPVRLAWSASGIQSADGVAVLRSMGDAPPTYPADVLETASGAEMSSYSDERVEPGRSYTYRVAYLAGGAVLCYSNPATASIPVPPPPLEVRLGGEMTTSGMYLKWYTKSAEGYDAWAVLVSRGGEPSYPGSLVDTVGGGQTASYLYSRMVEGQVYRFRIAALQGGQPVAYSNVIEGEAPAYSENRSR